MNMKLFNQALSHEDLRAIKKGMAKNKYSGQKLGEHEFLFDGKRKQDVNYI